MRLQLLLGLPLEVWAGAILGSVVIPAIWLALRSSYDWWSRSRPRRRVFQQLAADSEPCVIFMRDFVLAPGSAILAVEPRVGVGKVPNVSQLWADVDARALSYVLNALGQAGKRKNIRIVRMSEDTGIWNANIVVIGGQSQKSFDFYARLRNVSYRMDGQNIIDSQTGRPIPRDNDYGYGIILKARNPHSTHGGDGVGLLVGGFGTLGTAAAGYYLAQHVEDIGRQFGRKCFGIVVRTSVTAGEEAVERLPQYDRASQN